MSLYLKLDKASDTPIYRQIINQIRLQILSGQLASESRLPSVRELAGLNKVNPMTISKAFSFLEEEGLVENRKGIGLFVREIPEEIQTPSSEALLENMLDKGALLAVQLGISERQSLSLFKKLYSKYASKR